MIEQSLVYIYSTKPRRRFVGCGTLIEGGYIATCRHILRMATSEQDQASETLAVEIEYPRAFKDGVVVKASACLADSCEDAKSPPPDLVLLLPREIPAETMTLQLAREDRFEVRARLCAHRSCWAR